MASDYQVCITRDSSNTHVIEIRRGESTMRVYLTPEQFARAVTSGWVTDARADCHNLDLMACDIERVTVTVEDPRLRSWGSQPDLDREVALANMPEGEGWRFTRVCHTQHGKTITYYRPLAKNKAEGQEEER